MNISILSLVFALLSLYTSCKSLSITFFKSKVIADKNLVYYYLCWNDFYLLLCFWRWSSKSWIKYAEKKYNIVIQEEER